MKKIIYYLRIFTFILYLILMFILIDNFYKTDILRFIFYTLSIIYSLVMILTILSKKNVFKNLISYNLINIGLFVYLLMIFIVTFNSTKFEIMSNEPYFRNNLILLSVFLFSIIAFTLNLNKDDNLYS